MLVRYAYIMLLCRPMKLWEKVVVSLGTVLGLGMIFYGLAPEPQPKYKLPVAPVVTISPTPTAYRT